MEIGIGLDQGLGLSFDELRSLAREAVKLGYTSAWTPAGLARDAFQVCAQWSTATADLVDGGIATGIGVVPVPLWSPLSLAAVSATVGELSGGRFILGIGTGSSFSESERHRLNYPSYPAVALMRDFLVVLRQLLAGQAVEYAGTAITLRGAQLAIRPPRVPVYLGALGPQMLRLAGSHADGASLNWCSARQIAWSREQIVAGARRAGRDPREVQVVEYIRVCIDDDEDRARRAFVRAMMTYALARPGQPKDLAYRGHFGRMGFDAVLTEIEERRDRGAGPQEIVDAFPPELLRQVGYYGSAAGAPAALRQLAAGLDCAIIRVVPARPGADAVLATMRACRPELIGADRSPITKH